MRSRSLQIALLLLAATSSSRAQLDPNFQTRSMAHIRRLAGLGNRVSGSPGEAKAVRYIEKQFRKLGLAVVVEPFEFRSFTLGNAVLHSGGQDADIIRIIFDPYAGITRIEGEVVFVP